MDGCAESIMNLTEILSESGITLEMIVWPMFAGFVVACFAAMYNKKVIGAFVRRLMELKAFDRESAVTLEGCGFLRNRFVRFALRRRGTLRRTVASCDAASGEIADDSSAIPVTALKFFIPDDKQEKADMMYGSDGTSIVIVLFAILLFLVLAVLSFTVVPDLIQMLSNFISSL